MMPFVQEYIRSCDTYEFVTVGLASAYYVYPKTEATKIPSSLFIRKIMSRIDRLLRMFKIEKQLTYFLLPIRAPRRFPKNGEICEAKHINGAYTYPTSGEVYLFRCEEMAKVALHEACHHLPVHSQHWSISGTQRLCNAFGIDPNSTTLANEAIVEFWAEIFHCLSLSSEYRVPVDILLRKEISHGLSKTKKLLAYQRKYFGDKWRENTNAFAYIVFRTIILYHYIEFANMFPALRSSPYDTDAISDFLITKFQDANFTRAIKETRISTKGDMRMTVFGDL